MLWKQFAKHSVWRTTGLKSSASKEANAFICILLWGISTASFPFYQVAYFSLENYCHTRSQTVFFGKQSAFFSEDHSALIWSVLKLSTRPVLNLRSVTVSAGQKGLEIMFVTTSPDDFMRQWTKRLSLREFTDKLSAL